MFVILRWAPSPVETALAVGGVLLIALAVAGYLGCRRGVVAPFVAVALVMPYLLGGVAAYGGAQRAEAELSGLFSDLGVSEGGGPDAGATGEGMVEGGGEAPVAEEMPSVPFGEPGYFEGYAVTICSVEWGWTPSRMPRRTRSTGTPTPRWSSSRRHRPRVSRSASSTAGC